MVTKNRNTKRRGSGRPKGSRNKRTLAMELFCRKVVEEGIVFCVKEKKIGKGGKQTEQFTEKDFPPLLLKVVMDAHEGNSVCQKMIFEYGFGKPVETKKWQGTLSLPIVEFAQRVMAMTPQERGREAAHLQKLGAKVLTLPVKSRAR